MTHEQKPEALQKARTPRGDKQPPSPAVCKALTFLAAVAAGCTGVPTRPEPFECPERVQNIMFKKLGWKPGYEFLLMLDDRFDADKDAVFRPGAEVVGWVPERGLDAEQKKLIPPGTKFWGRVYVDPQDESAKERGEPAALRVKYERAKLPGQEEVPVCVIARGIKVYTMDKDGVTKADNSGSGYVQAEWNYSSSEWP